jgi:hypothetical protein
MWRVMCLEALRARLFAEDEVHRRGPDPLSRYLVNISERLGGEDALLCRWSSRERPLWTAPLGTIASLDLENASWIRENMGVLLWALGRAQLPHYDTQVTTELDVIVDLSHVELLTRPRPRLRPKDELVRARDIAEVWFAAALDARMRRQRGKSILEEKFIRRIVENEPTFQQQDDELVLYGKRYSCLSPEQEQEALSIAYERYYTFFWLIGDRYRGRAREWDADERTFAEPTLPHLAF